MIDIVVPTYGLDPAEGSRIAAGMMRTAFLNDWWFVEDTHGQGWAATCNRGAAAGHQDRIAFVNQDAVLSPTWLTGVLEAMDADSNLVIAGPRIDDGLPWPRTAPGLDHWVCGACMVVDRTFFEAAGGFDAALFPHEYAETDLERTAQAAGLKVRTIETDPLLVRHPFNPAKSEQVLEWRRLGARNEAAKWGVGVDPWAMA